MDALFRLLYRLTFYLTAVLLCPRLGGIKRWCASDVWRLSVTLSVCLSIYLSHTLGLSRKQRRLEDKNWHRGRLRHTWLGHHFQGQKVKGQLAGLTGGILWRPPAQLIWHLTLIGILCGSVSLIFYVWLVSCCKLPVISLSLSLKSLFHVVWISAIGGKFH